MTKTKFFEIYRRSVPRPYSLPITTRSNSVYVVRAKSGPSIFNINENYINRHVKSSSSSLSSASDIQTNIIPKTASEKYLIRSKHNDDHDDVPSKQVQQNSRISSNTVHVRPAVFDDIRIISASTENIPVKIIRHSTPSVTFMEPIKTVSSAYNYNTTEKPIIPKSALRTSAQTQQPTPILRSSSKASSNSYTMQQKLITTNNKQKITQRQYCGQCFAEYFPCCSKCCCLLVTIPLTLLIIAIFVTLLVLFLTKKIPTTLV